MDMKCPKCSAVLKLNEDKKYTCEYCKSEFDASELNKKINSYVCKKCNAKLISYDTINTCIHCKNSEIEVKTIDNFNPSYIVPFEITKEVALKKIKKLYKNKWLKPKQFKNIKNIKGIYMPYALFCYDAIGEVESECDTKSSWMSAGYRYVKKDTYKVIRGGNMSFDNIPVEGSKNISSEVLDSIGPYNYKKSKPFDFSYLNDYISEEYEFNKEELLKNSINKTKKYFIEEMEKDITNYNDIKIIDDRINLNNIKYIRILLPMWILKVDYNNKIYTIAVNGQTGAIEGTIPKSKSKALIIWVILFILSFILIFTTEYLKVTL